VTPRRYAKRAWIPQYSPRESVNERKRNWPDVRVGRQDVFLGGLDFMNVYRLFRSRVYMKLKNVGPGVVPTTSKAYFHEQFGRG
jgi:hypothetical protein